jgi:hypothetical protein
MQESPLPFFREGRRGVGKKRHGHPPILPGQFFDHNTGNASVDCSATLTVRQRDATQYFNQMRCAIDDQKMLCPSTLGVYRELVPNSYKIFLHKIFEIFLDGSYHRECRWLYFGKGRKGRV